MKTRDLILEVTPKRSLHDLCGRKFTGKSCTKTFRASLGRFGQNFAPQTLPNHMLKKYTISKLN